MQLITNDIALSYTRKAGTNDVWSVPEFMAFLQLEVQSRERAQQLTRPNCVQRDAVHKPFNKIAPGSESRPKRLSTPSAAALHTACPTVPTICVFCDSTTHKSECCPDYSVSARKEKLKKMGRCFVCLGTRHIAKFCKVKGVTCPLCSRRRHQSVCEQYEEKPETSSMTDTVVSSVSSTVNIRSREPNTVLLQTAEAWTEGPGGRKIIQCLIDGGSQQSFVNEMLVRSLQLPVLR